MYQSGPRGGLSAAELDGVLATFGELSSNARAESMRYEPTEYTMRTRAYYFGIARTWQLAQEHLCAVVGWQCSHNPSFLPHRTAIVCDLPALFVDDDGNRWCADHVPDTEVTISEHDDQRAVDE